MRVLFRLILCLFVSALAAVPAGAEALPERAGWIGAAGPGASYRSAGEAWQDALANMPIATGTSLRTGAKGNAELRFAEATIVLGADSEIDIARYSGNGLQVVLRRGEIGLRLERLPGGVSIEVDTERGGVWLLQPGRYALKAGGEASSTSVAVFEGRARFVGGGLDRIVATDTETLISGSETAGYSSGAVAADPFAAWWQDHAVAAADPASPLPVALPGATALSGGTWQHSDAYGAVWFPDNTPADWAPFHSGRWRAIAPWGWTWIDEAPWGFVPSHYGRWVRLKKAGEDGERWGWIPGTAVSDAAYVPATVAFMGTAGIGLSYPGGSGPAVAWFPLGPGEPYWPGDTGDAEAIRRTNGGAGIAADLAQPAEDRGPPAAVATGHYRYRAFAGVVPRAVFAAGKPVAPALLSLPVRRLEVAPVLGGIAPVPAQRQTVAQHLPAQKLMVTQRVPVPRPAVKPVKTAIAASAPRHAKTSLAAADATAKRHLAKPHLAKPSPGNAKLHLAARKRRAAPHVAAVPSGPLHGRQHLAAARPALRQ